MSHGNAATVVGGLADHDGPPIGAVPFMCYKVASIAKLSPADADGSPLVLSMPSTKQPPDLEPPDWDAIGSRSALDVQSLPSPLSGTGDLAGGEAPSNQGLPSAPPGFGRPGAGERLPHGRPGTLPFGAPPLLGPLATGGVPPVGGFGSLAPGAPPPLMGGTGVPPLLHGDPSLPLGHPPGPLGALPSMGAQQQAMQQFGAGRPFALGSVLGADALQATLALAMLHIGQATRAAARVRGGRAVGAGLPRLAHTGRTSCCSIGSAFL